MRVVFDSLWSPIFVIEKLFKKRGSLNETRVGLTATFQGLNFGIISFTSNLLKNIPQRVKSKICFIAIFY